MRLYNFPVNVLRDVVKKDIGAYNIGVIIKIKDLDNETRTWAGFYYRDINDGYKDSLNYTICGIMSPELVSDQPFKPLIDALYSGQYSQYRIDEDGKYLNASLSEPTKLKSRWDTIDT